MRTSLTEIKLIDDYIFDKAETGDALVFDALLIINPELKSQIMWQKKTHQLVKQYGRKTLKQEIENVHRQLFDTDNHLSFRQKILRLFSK
jgi:hypothetical protein